ncbi:histidine phosphatase family protein [Paenibacillus monticola]|uniref:Histidine phosphatase family protein n=1 Tax=Paenibacillus monticola TaxID=2666075 RepID=A0A7X2L3M3_9BACL|nr:histidine phosphatase family protein [Paenibacillus monticola]MRN56107.1 histidine phosphatase family protein [Paenibacillus monticola]
MTTYIYFVRHSESSKSEGNERTRGLTDKGKLDSRKITELLKNEEIDTFISSPYSRAMMTIEEVAQQSGKEILVFEDLRELVFSREDMVIPDKEVYSLVNKMFMDPNYKEPYGESINDCQRRSVARLKEIIKNYKGQKIAIGTHGLVMTLMMRYFDDQYGYEFLMKTSKPDVYRLEFNGEELVNTQRIYKNVTWG